MNCLVYRRYGKRATDLLVCVCALLILLPILLLTCIAVKISSRGPIFFFNIRIGRDGKLFTLIKFRTFSVNALRSPAEVKGKIPELTPVGYLLRRLKIDELPQLLNVLRGEMSLIGPRPCMPETLHNFQTESIRQRLKVRPGLTGWAQVNGNIYLSWEERWKYDIFYTKNYSLFLDLKIFLKTIMLIIVGEKYFLDSDKL